MAHSLSIAQQPIPSLQARVTDLTATLNTSQITELESKLAAFEARKGVQVAVLIIPTTEPEVIEEYGIRLADAWKIGRKGVDDGVILLIAKNDRRMRIEVGYGLEGILPDAIAKRIIAETIAPRFRQGDFYGGVVSGTEQILHVIEGEALPPPSTKVKPRNSGHYDIGALLPVAFILVFTIGSALRRLFGRFLGALTTGGVMGLIASIFVGVFAASIAGIAAFVLTLVFGGLTKSGIWSTGGFGPSGWSGGGGGWGSGSGSSWGGGGGGFGGGGASGDW